MQQLLDPALNSESLDSTVDTVETTPTKTAPAQEEVQKSESKETTTAVDSKVEDLIQQYAKETGLDPNDPGQRLTLKRLADKELFIQKLQAEKSVSTTQAPKTEGDGLLTEFEKSLRQQESAADKPAGEAGETTETKTAAAPGPAADTFRYGDIGDEWKGPEDSLKALNQAWAEENFDKVQQIEMARLRRNLDTEFAPAIIKAVQKMLDDRLQAFEKQNLGDVLPEVRRGVEERRNAESRDFAIAELRKAGASDIDKLFDVEDGNPIQFDGKQFPNTPLNRIIAKFPQILQLRVQNADPATAARMTFIERYRMAYQLYKSQGIPAETAKQLVEAGAKSKERQEADRTRHTLNAGPGATSLGGEKGNRSYVSELNNMPGEIPFASLLG